MPTPTIVSYRRVSTEEQGNSGLGLEAQAAAISAELARRGWTLAADYTDVASAKKRDGRPGLQQAIAHARRDRGIFIAAKYDRVSRSVIDFAEILRDAERNGWKVLVVDTPDVDMTTANGELQAHILIALAQWERRKIGERTSAALQALKASGKRLGQPRQTPDDVVARVVRERDAGRSWPAIARGLDEDGVPTARGGTWRVSTVQGIYRSHQLDLDAETARREATVA